MVSVQLASTCQNAGRWRNERHSNLDRDRSYCCGRALMRRVSATSFQPPTEERQAKMLANATHLLMFSLLLIAFLPIILLGSLGFMNKQLRPSQ